MEPFIPAVHYSFNPWWGCTRVSAGCDHCYAEAMDVRAGGGHWGPDAPRRTFGDRYWSAPLRWDAEAARRGVGRPRVLAASMADVFDAAAPEGARERLWALVRRTPHLDWLVLTRRPGRIARGLPADWGDGYRNVWLGVTVEDAEAARQRLPVLAATPAWLRFACVEPLLGPVDLRPWLDDLDWVVAGGESGPDARPLHPAWVRDVRDACVEARVPFYLKQWGEHLPEDHVSPYVARHRREVSRGVPGFEQGPRMFWVGRGRAGRTLDGQVWQQVPRSPGATSVSTEEAPAA